MDEAPNWSEGEDVDINVIVGSNPEGGGASAGRRRRWNSVYWIDGIHVKGNCHCFISVFRNLTDNAIVMQEKTPRYCEMHERIFEHFYYLPRTTVGSRLTFAFLVERFNRIDKDEAASGEAGLGLAVGEEWIFMEVPLWQR